VTVAAAPLLELVGVAGAGKTTLLKELKRRDPSLFTEVTIRNLDRLALLVRHTVRFLPALLSHAPRGRWLSWEELRAMGYLQGWRRIVQGHRSSPLVFDHGPIFRLVQLRELGPPLVASPAFVAWWQSQRRAWSRAIDLVVWLDAPDAVLIPRITGRDQRHVVKHMPVGPALDFLTTYRKGYKRLLTEMGDEGHFRLIAFDTSRVVPEAIADEVLGAVGRGGVAAGTRQCVREGAPS
jgi:shikimate kinase